MPSNQLCHATTPPSTDFCNTCRRSKTILNNNSHDSRLVTRMQEAARTNMHKSHSIIEFDAQLSCTIFCPRYCRTFLSTRFCVRAIGSAVLTYAFLTGHRNLYIVPVACDVRLH